MEEFWYQLKEGRIGKVPVWAAGIIIAGAFAGIMWWRNRRINQALSNTPVSQDDTSVFYDSTVGGNVSWPTPVEDYLASDPRNPAYPVGLNPQGIPAPITNEQWARLAFDYLVGLGNDPTLVQNALRKYLDGMTVTSAEQSIINLANRAFGAPPEGLILVNVGDSAPPQSPSQPQPNSPPSSERRFVYVARYTEPNPPWNSTLWGIATRYGRTVEQLIQWNNLAGRPRAGGAPIIYTGEKIWVDP